MCFEKIGTEDKEQIVIRQFKLFGIAAAAVFITAAWGEASVIQPEFAAGRILVKFNTGVQAKSVKSIIYEHRGVPLKRIPQIGIHVVGFNDERVDLEDKIREFENDPRVEYAELDYILHAAAVYPDDPYFSLQWALSNTGQTGGVSGADIDTPSAWDRTTGNSSIVIAVIDSGVDLNHPDLKNKIVAGYDFVNGDSIPQDDAGHGTHVAGIAAAETNNGVGIAGVSWNSKIMPVKVLDASGSGSFSDCCLGICYAADNGAHVINMSFGGWVPYYDETLHSAVQYAYARGAVLTAAAGNDGWPIEAGWYVCVPAAYSECITVAATNSSDTVTWWSNYGPQVDVAAPGEYIYSTFWNASSGSTYAYLNGTSMSSPFAAGLCALILADKPWLTNEEVMYKVCYSAEDINSAAFPGADDYAGYGRINASVAVVPVVVNTQ